MNTFINEYINMDSKGVNKVYKSLSSGKDTVLINIMHEWIEKTGQKFTHDEGEKAFIIDHQSNINSSMYMH